MERKNSDDKELLRRISRDRLLEINVKLSLDALCLFNVTRLHVKRISLQVFITGKLYTPVPGELWYSLWPPRGYVHPRFEHGVHV